MDFHRLQQKLFEMDPTDPREDLAKLQQVAQGGSAASGTVEPTKDYLRENAEVAEGSLKMDRDYSVSDFAALAGIKTNEATPLDALKHGFKNYNKLDALNTQVDGKKPKSDVGQTKDLTKGKDKKPTAQQPTQQPAQAQPSAMPTSDEGYTLKAGDDITYVNKKGQRRTAPAVKMLKNLDTNGKNVIQLELNGATFAISRDQIIAVNKEMYSRLASYNIIYMLLVNLKFAKSKIEFVMPKRDGISIWDRTDDPPGLYELIDMITENSDYFGKVEAYVDYFSFNNFILTDKPSKYWLNNNVRKYTGFFLCNYDNSLDQAIQKIQKPSLFGFYYSDHPKLLEEISDQTVEKTKFCIEILSNKIIEYELSKKKSSLIQKSVLNYSSAREKLDIISQSQFKSTQRIRRRVFAEKKVRRIFVFP